VKRQGGCGLVVSEMVSSEGLVRGIDRTLEYAEYTEEERPVSIQIFGGDPAKMAEAARVVERMGANIVDVNMGCPVPKIAKHNAGCSLMREPGHAAAIIAAMAKAVRIPVTVKMRKGWDDAEVSAPELARRVEDAGAKAIAIHGRTAKQSYSGSADWDFVSTLANTVSIPVFGSGDCIEPEDIITRMQSGVSGVYVGRGVLRNPWILAQARDLMEGRPARRITLEDRGQFLLDYVRLLLSENQQEEEGFRHTAGREPKADSREQGTRERWVINKVRALCAWYTKGFEGGARFRIGVNSVKSIAELEDLIQEFFLLHPVATSL
jgi:tRNA-dihydrouridine synthase B